jgi:hypothetical protein
MSFLFILDDIMSTGYVNMTAEELRGRLVRLATGQVRPITKLVADALVGLRALMIEIIMDARYPGKGITSMLFAPEWSYDVVDGYMILSKRMLDTITPVKWAQIGGDFTRALEEVEWALEWAKDNKRPHFSDNGEFATLTKWEEFFLRSEEEMENDLTHLYEEWEPTREEAKSVKTFFRCRMQPGESKASEALRRSGKEISWENIDEVISAENTYIREFEAVVMEHFGITPEIFDNPPPTIDQGISWWRRRLHLPEEHEGASRIRLEEQVIEDLVAE